MAVKSGAVVRKGSFIHTLSAPPWQVCAPWSPRFTLWQSTCPTGTCWIISASATARRSVQSCCSTWPHRSPLPWSTWRRRTSSTGGWSPIELLQFQIAVINRPPEWWARNSSFWGVGIRTGLSIGCVGFSTVLQFLLPRTLTAILCPTAWQHLYSLYADSVHPKSCLNADKAVP